MNKKDRHESEPRAINSILVTHIAVELPVAVGVVEAEHDCKREMVHTHTKSTVRDKIEEYGLSVISFRGAGALPKYFALWLSVIS